MHPAPVHDAEKIMPIHRGHRLCHWLGVLHQIVMLRYLALVFLGVFLVFSHAHEDHPLVGVFAHSFGGACWGTHTLF